MSEKKNIGYQIKSIISNQFAILEDSFIVSETPTLDLSFFFGYEAERHLITCRTKFTFTSSKGLFMIIEASCIFDIEKSSWDTMMQEDGNLRIDKYFATHISALTIGTVRGMLHAKTEQTIYNLVFIPIINVGEFITEDIVLKNKE